MRVLIDAAQVFDDRAALRDAGTAGDQQQILVQRPLDANVAERPFDRYFASLCVEQFVHQRGFGDARQRPVMQLEFG